MATFRTEITADATQYNSQMESVAAKSLTTSQAIQSAFRETSLQMSSAISTANENMNKSFDSVKSRVESIRGVVVAMAAVVGGGSLFGKVIGQTVELTGESTKLQRVLGGTTAEASVLRMALDDIGVGTDDYLAMAQKMTMKLRENEDRFNALGVATRGSNGQLLGTEELMGNTARALEQFKAGTDRNLAASELFGKGWADVMKLMRLTPAAMDEARAKAESLQLVVGEGGAARVKAYKLALNDTKDVLEAMANRVGQAVMPVLTDLGHWLSDIGPTAVQVMRGAIGGLMTVFYAFRNGVVVVLETVLAAIYMVTEPIVALFSAVGSAMTGNFEEAGARLREVPKGIEKAWQTAGENILKSGDTTRSRIAALWSFGAEQGGAGRPKGGNRTWTPPAAAAASTGASNRMGDWEAELASERDAYERRKLEQGSFEQFSLQMERDFWKTKMQQTDLSVQELAALSKRYYAAERELRKEAFDLEMADMKARIDEHRKGSVERIQIAGEQATKIGEKYGLESKEYRAALAVMAKLAQDRADQQQKLQEQQVEAERNYQLARVDLERANLETLEKLGIIDAQTKIARLKELAEIEFAIKLKAAEDEAALRAQDEVAHAQALEKIAEIRRKHEADMQKLGNEGALATKKTIDTWLDPIGNAVQTMVNGVLQGTQTAGQLVMNLMRNLAAQVGATLVKMGLDWVKTEILKTNATVGGVTARTGAETAGAVQSRAITGTSALQTIGTKAWEAAASVYSSIASIPVVGPFMAPALAAAAAATVLGFAGRIASASGGYDIPSGQNPMVQAHAEEMILPRDIANPLRASLDGGGMGGGTSVTIYALDSADVERTLMRDPQALDRPVRRLARNGGNYRRW